MFDFSCEEYYRELDSIVKNVFPKKSFSILITGVTGLIGSCMVDALIYANEALSYDIQIYASGRNLQRVKNRFGKYTDKPYFHAVIQDASEPLDSLARLDYMVCAASNADPRTYKEYPVETIVTNIFGMRSILEKAKADKGSHVLFLSTNEVYGAVSHDGYIYEDEVGFVDYNNIRSGYPESKRTAELLLRSYVEEYGINAVIARLSLIYGPTMTATDNKVVAQFIRSIIKKEDICLQSMGKTKRSYCYVTDCVSALYLLLFKGENGEAYNVANDELVSIRLLAETAASIGGTKVIFNLPDDYDERNQPTDKLLGTKKLKELGWKPIYDIKEGLETTVRILTGNQ